MSTVFCLLTELIGHVVSLHVGPDLQLQASTDLGGDESLRAPEDGWWLRVPEPSSKSAAEVPPPVILGDSKSKSTPAKERSTHIIHEQHSVTACDMYDFNLH